jgi:hypothetical protein
MLSAGVLLLFLVPGLCAYAALYGLFHSGKAIAPTPPSANTVEAVIIIVGASLLVHAATAICFAADAWVCRHGCLVEVPRAWLNPYGSAVHAIEGGAIGGAGITLALAGTAAQGLGSYGLVRSILAMLARRDRLPAWIYGWAVPLANAVDNRGGAVFAYVLTSAEMQGKAVGYGGLVYDLALKPDGCVSRITLHNCERYLVDLASPSSEPSLSGALSRMAFMIIEASNIRNIAFEAIRLDVEAA